MRVMVIGASRDRRKFGNRALRAHLEQGHEVFPVHPHATCVESVSAYPDVASVPGPIDRAILYVPAEVGLQLLPALAERADVAELWVSPGAESPQLLERARQLDLRTIQACSIMAIGATP